MASKQKMAADDPRIDDDAPMTDAELARARPGRELFAERGLEPPRPIGRPKADNPKRQVTLRLDAEVVDHFKAGGKGWQTRVNETLRKAIASE